jgi:hypothetical protein
MKTLIQTMLLLLCMMPIAASAGNDHKNKEESLFCLEIIGIAIDSAGQPVHGAEVKLFKENDEMEWVEVTSVIHHEHRFNFKLEANQYYTIEVRRPGYVSRSIGISTKLPDEISLATLFHYEFEVELFQEKQSVDDFYLDFPVALIRYDPKRDVFDNSISYSRHIKGLIRETTGIKETSTYSRH